MRHRSNYVCVIVYTDMYVPTEYRCKGVRTSRKRETATMLSACYDDLCFPIDAPRGACVACYTRRREKSSATR